MSIAKKNVIFTMIFSVFAIVFALLYHFKVISKMDLALAFIYVTYFVGLALIYNGCYFAKKANKPVAITSFVIGFLAILGAACYLLYGLITETIVLFA